MYRNLLLFLAFIVLSNIAYAETYRCQDEKGYYSFSATPCSTAGSAEAASESEQYQQGARSRSEYSSSGRNVYTKDLPAMQSADGATQACFNHVNTTAHFPDPATSKLLTSSKKWVTVKHVGGRQMVTIGVTSKNEAGMYVGVQLFNCLLMGDNATINTDSYELL